jgi:hypothetical protein
VPPFRLPRLLTRAALSTCGHAKSTFLSVPKLRQERHVYSGSRPSSAQAPLGASWPGTPALSHSPLIGRQTCRSCRSLDGFWEIGCYKHATPMELLCLGLIPPEAARNEIPSGSDCPWQACKNHLAYAAGKQDESGVHHATAASGNQDVSATPALLAGVGAKEEAVSELMKLRSPLYAPHFLWHITSTGRKPQSRTDT